MMFMSEYERTLMDKGAPKYLGGADGTHVVHASYCECSDCRWNRYKNASGKERAALMLKWKTQLNARPSNAN